MRYLFVAGADLLAAATVVGAATVVPADMGMKKRRRLLGDNDDDLALNEGLYMALECEALTAGHPDADRLIRAWLAVSRRRHALVHRLVGLLEDSYGDGGDGDGSSWPWNRAAHRHCPFGVEKRRGIKSLLILVAWEIWKERNSRLFQSIETTPCGIIDRATEEIWLWRAGGAKSIQSLMPDDRGSTTNNL